MQCRVSLVRDGEEAMRSYTARGFSPKRRAPTWSSWMELPKRGWPPGANEEIRADDSLKSIPVVVLTASLVQKAVLRPKTFTWTTS